MLKKLFDGLVFGTGFGIAFAAIWVIAFYFIVPNVVGNQFGSGPINEKEVNTAPELNDTGRYLGSSGIYSGNFPTNKNEVLTAGPGRIIGKALANGEPVEGLKLRLALNGSVMSQWATTNSNGQYEVKVPYGKYTVDGFSLDTITANKSLPNKIIHPRRSYTRSAFEVSPENKGNGPDFSFVDPVSKKIINNTYSVTDKVVLEWESYPNSAGYYVQLYEKVDADAWRTETLFDWSDRPKVSDSQIDLKEFDVQLEPGHFYTYEISAFDQDGRIISKSARTHSGYDFKVVK